MESRVWQQKGYKLVTDVFGMGRHLNDNEDTYRGGADYPIQPNAAQSLALEWVEFGAGTANPACTVLM